VIIPRDTSPDAFLVQARLLRRLSPAERFEKAMAFCDEIREMTASGIRRRHPDFDEAQVREELGRIVLGAAAGVD
jgi:hypothetical protein